LCSNTIIKSHGRYGVKQKTDIQPQNSCISISTSALIKSTHSTKTKKGSEMELLNSTSCKSSALLELMVSVVLIAGVSLGVYAIQHPHQTAQQQMMTALQQ